jgi:hypothetical protein
MTRWTIALSALALWAWPAPALAHGSGWPMALLVLAPLDALLGLAGCGAIATGKLSFAGTGPLGRAVGTAFLLGAYAALWASPARYFLAPAWVAIPATALPLALTFGAARWARRATRRALWLSLAGVALLSAGVAVAASRYVRAHTADDELYRQPLTQARGLIDEVVAFADLRGRVPESIDELGSQQSYRHLSYRAVTPERFVVSFSAPRYGSNGRYEYDSARGFFVPTAGGVPQSVKVMVTDLPWFLKGR